MNEAAFKTILHRIKGVPDHQLKGGEVESVPAETLTIAGELPLRAQVVERVRGDNGTPRAVLAYSDLLEDHFWLILDRAFIPMDSLAQYYPEELVELKKKNLEELRYIHQVKLIFPGCRVIQEGPDG